MRVPRLTTLLLAAFAAVLLAPWTALLAKDATVTTKDGRQITGEVVSDDASGVTLKISGIQTSIPAASIQKTEYKESVEEAYQRQRAQIADNNLEDRYKLASWLFEEKGYILAKRELDDLSKRFPDDQRVKLLARVVDEKVKLINEAPPKEPTPQPRPSADGGPRPPKPAKPAPEVAPVASDRLNDDQVNIIKVYEVDPANEPRVIVPREVLDALFKRHADDDAVPKGRDDQAALRAAPGYRQLDVIFKARARELYSKVKIVDDPKPLQVFKTNIHRNYVIQYCGAANCHGGDKAGEFFVFRNQPDTDKTVYTNYYTLYQYQNARGFMLDFGKPENSLLLQYGLVRDAATLPHPEVPGMKQNFSGPDDPRFQAITAWVASLGSIRQTYPISYTRPKPKPAATTTQPAHK